MKARLFHNPRCSKSRQALALLQEKNIEFETIEYLKTPLNQKELTELFKKLDLKPEDAVRKKESVFKEQNLDASSFSDKEWINFIALNPIVLERPIFDNGDKAIIGRPPEDILKLI